MIFGVELNDAADEVVGELFEDTVERRLLCGEGSFDLTGLVDVLREKGWRIEQMPWPELAFTGLNRFWAVKEQLDTAAYRRHCERLAEAVAAAISVRVTKGEDVVLVGVEGSPSMGVTVTSSDPLRGGRPE